MKGWYGNRQAHSLASKGIKTKMNARGHDYDYKVDEIEEGDYRITIRQDDYPESPREWDNLGHMVTWHSNYDLGDEQPQESAQEWMEELEEVYGNKMEVIPLYLYDHSGITMNTTGYSHMGMYGYFDSGQVGWIYITHDDIKKEYGKVTPETIAKARKVLEGEVDAYDTYITGEVYAFSVEKKMHCVSCEHDDWETIDSCSGFYGDWRDKDAGIIDHLPEEVEGMFKKLAGWKNKEE